MHATLRLALRWHLWDPRTRLRLIRLLMRWDSEQVSRVESGLIAPESVVMEVLT
jgi:hypothetical protein